MSVVLITGAAGGLGWALSRAFYQRGDQLYLVDRDGDALQQAIAQLPDSSRVIGQTIDLTAAGAINAIVSGIESAYGQLDIAVNNAGITHRSLAARTRPEVFQRVMKLDWQVPVELSLALLPLLRAGERTIISIGSMASWMPVPGRAGYCSAKAALAQFFEVLRVEEADLRILMAYPTFLDTAIERNALGADGDRANHARSTIGRISDADTMARRIIAALEQGKGALYGSRFTWLASLLWRLAPGLYLRMIRRQFAVELEAH